MYIDSNRPAAQLIESDVEELRDSSKGWWFSFVDSLILIVSISALMAWFVQSELLGPVLGQKSASEFEHKEMIDGEFLGNKTETSNQKNEESIRQLYVEVGRVLSRESLSHLVSLEKIDNALLMKFTGGVLFSDDRVSLSRSGKALLEPVAQIVSGLDVKLEIIGHNDLSEALAKEFASEEELAQERAIDVLDFFAIKGISDARMKVLPYNEQNAEHNRRISVRLF